MYRAERAALKAAMPLLRTQGRLVARFVVTSIARMALIMAGVLLIREFLAGVLGETVGFASTLARSLGATAALWTVAGLLVLSFVGASLVNYDRHVVQQRIVRAIELGLMDRLIRHLLTLSVPFFDRQSHGDVIQAVRQDVSNLRAVVLSLGTLFFEGIFALGLFFSALWISPTLAFWVLLVLPVASFPLLWIARRTRARSYRVRRSGYVLFDMLLQILRGIRVIKIFHGERQEAATAVARANHYFDELLEIVRLGALSRMVLEALGGLSVVAVVIVGGYQVMAGGLSWAGLMAFLVAARAIQGPLNNFLNNYLEMQRHSAAIYRVSTLLDERPEVREAPDAIPLVGAPTRIVFDNVSFEASGRVILANLNFEVRAGETVGIAGPSGAGKTTLLNLIARFYDPTAGTVRFDGRDLRDFQLADVYDKLAIVTQEPFLFATTVRQNIRCGRPDASDDAVRDAARAAGIDEEILAMPAGYETVIGPAGHPLSAGQAQRINVARAIVKNAPILLLDEATSNLDSIAETKVQRAIDQLLGERTTFVVAHRLSTLRHASRILVLDRQRCVGFQPHENLLAECPLYREMWETQASHQGKPLG